MPRPKDKTYKLKTFSKNKTQKKNTILHSIPEEEQESYLTREIEINPLLRELVSKDVIFLALGSSTFQNLETKLRN
jgi:hypothetical protein